MSSLAFLGLQNIGPVEGLMILALGLLLFGKRLPDVGRSLGKGIVEFKRGLKGMADEIEDNANRPAPASASRNELPSSAASAPAAPFAAASPEAARVSRGDSVE